jgi:hypothetical protein
MDTTTFRRARPVIYNDHRHAYVYEEPVEYILDDLPNIPDVPYTPTLHNSLGSRDPRSSWDFKAVPRKGSAGAATSSSRTTYTEAEEIAAMYRARILEIHIPQRPDSVATREGRELVKDDMSAGPSSSLVDLERSPMTPRPTFRMSRVLALHECVSEIKTR